MSRDVAGRRVIDMAASAMAPPGGWRIAIPPSRPRGDRCRRDSTRGPRHGSRDPRPYPTTIRGASSEAILPAATRTASQSSAMPQVTSGTRVVGAGTRIEQPPSASAATSGTSATGRRDRGIARSVSVGKKHVTTSRTWVPDGIRVAVPAQRANARRDPRALIAGGHMSPISKGKHDD